MNRTATAVWNGTGKEGKGHLTTQSKALNKAQYSWHARFEEAQGTNPEELIAAAHAGCYTMKLSFLIVEAGFTPEEITTTATVTMEEGTITSSRLVIAAKVPGMDAEKFGTAAMNAKNNCPVSKALNVNITIEAKLA